jgi:DUF917 family protein
MKKIDKEDIKNLLLGSIFYGCGGGLPYKDNLKFAKEIFKIKEFVMLKDLDEFNGNEWVFSIYAVGDPSRVDLDFKYLISEAFKAYKKLTNIRKFTGVIPGEIGAEILSFQAATFLNLPVVDTDLVGGRAAPEIQMDMFSVYNLKIIPFLAYTANKLLYFDGDFEAKELESLSRIFFHSNNGSGIVIGYPIKVRQLKNRCIKETVSRSLITGRFLTNRNLEELKKFVGCIKVLEEVFQKCSLESRHGFLEGFLFFKKHKIYVKNENIFLINYKNKVIYKAPDLIVVLDEDLKPVHNTTWKRKKMRVKILLIPSSGYWKTKKGKELWDLKFNLDKFS